MTYGVYYMKYLLPLFLLIFTPSHAFDASYEGEELILLERMPINISDEGWRQFIYPNTIPLGSIYWNSNNNQYYYVKDGTRLTKTNGVTYKLDPIKQQEPSFIGEPQDTQLVYAGYISSKERLYIDPKTQKQYIKVLEPVHDEEELVPELGRWSSGVPSRVTYWQGDTGTYREKNDGTWDISASFRQD